jgi:hypothetical protein
VNLVMFAQFQAFGELTQTIITPSLPVASTASSYTSKYILLAIKAVTERDYRVHNSIVMMSFEFRYHPLLRSKIVIIITSHT